ncbi:MAG: hypothetical protein KGI08_08390 [Thaumarchaeota archaeon]|nr:hypothetical protein [Nitrososphaerota archaeon]
MVYSKYQSDVKLGKVVGYCFDPKHVYSPVKVVTVKKIRLQVSGSKSDSLDPGYTLRNIKCILDGKPLYFDRKSSFQLGGKIVGNCFKSHRVEQIIVAKPVNEPDCKEIIQVIIKRSKY